MNTEDFLRAVITTPDGYFCLAVGLSAKQGWREIWFNWPEQLPDIVATVNETAPEYNVYFTAHLFSQPNSSKVNVLPSRTIQADLDEADLATIPLLPSVLVNTSPGRHQGYWILKQDVDNDTLEVLSRKITYSIPLCDHSGWPLGHRMRVPNTQNHKYLEGPVPVTVTSSSLRTYDPSEVELLSDVDSVASAALDTEWIDGPHDDLDTGPQELLESIKGKISPKIYTQYNNPARDRSAALWSLMCAAFRAGLDRDEVFWLAINSANNKFTNLRFHGERELAKDVLRAEQVVASRIPDIRAAVLEARRLPGLTAEKRRYIYDLVMANLKETGDFIRTDDDNIWYIRRDLGRPILISQNSEYLKMILDLQFGLNGTEGETAYVTAGMGAYVRSLPSTATSASLSYYDADAHTVYLHTGRKEVVRITEHGIERTTDGAYGVVFPWNNSNEPFTPNFNPLPCPWAELVFGSHLDNALVYDREETLALLRTWLLFLLLRSSVVTRPILAFLGQPGAGKSTLFRTIFALLYGGRRSLGGVTTPEDYDHAVSTDPLVVLDNVDTWERWLPDRLAQSASTSDVIKRKLYTDFDTVRFKRQALVGITAHNPRFGREDVADRLLLITFERLPHFRPEGELINKVLRYRNQIWGAIAQDLQTVILAEPPPADKVPQFRIEDFARLGYQIAQALGYADAFASALRRVYTGQRMFSLEEDSLLVSAIMTYLRKRTRPAEYISVSQLWSDLESCCSDPRAFDRIYRNAVFLGKKLWALQESLKEVIDISWEHHQERGSRFWKLETKHG